MEVVPPARAAPRPPYRSLPVLLRIPRLLLPMLAVLGVGIAVVHLRDRARDRLLARRARTDAVEIAARTLEREVEGVRATLLYLAGQSTLRRFLDGQADRGELEAECAHFCRTSGAYDQMRMLDEDGREVLRINYGGGAARAVPVSELQDKADRYYFVEAASLPRGEVYVSPFDLNVEHGHIEEPWKPVLRLATPIFDSDGHRRGLLVLNCLGASLLQRLSRAAGGQAGWIGLVDGRGHYLVGPDAERSWGFMFDREPTFVADHPEAWERVRAHVEGDLLTPEALFSFRPVRPLEPSVPAARVDLDLTAVSVLPLPSLYAASRHTLRRLLVGSVLAGVLLASVAWRLAYASAVRAQHEERLAASEQRLRELSRRLLDAHEAERRRLSRDLHDELGQLATALTIDLKRVARIEGVDQRRSLVQRASATCEALLESMHRLASQMRPSLLDDLGPSAALRALCLDFESRNGVSTDVRLDFEDGDVSDATAVDVYRLVQEGLANVAKHARAEHVTVAIERRADRLAIAVRDDGVGFDAASPPPDRLGLLGMRERVELLGGTLTLHSEPDQGTSIEARIPLAEPTPQEPT